ncbi:uncharacterized protein LOC143694549 [Agelaius phoeniceus]|uniref:uncharacterized protein LOC143694549 n=1 Tax=Agelaius phoeniceus TaxID=39638 RepID=UPI004054EB5F
MEKKALRNRYKSDYCRKWLLSSQTNEPGRAPPSARPRPPAPRPHTDPAPRPLPLPQGPDTAAPTQPCPRPAKRQALPRSPHTRTPNLRAPNLRTSNRRPNRCPNRCPPQRPAAPTTPTALLCAAPPPPRRRRCDGRGLNALHSKSSRVSLRRWDLRFGYWRWSILKILSVLLLITLSHILGRTVYPASLLWGEKVPALQQPEDTESPQGEGFFQDHEVAERRWEVGKETICRQQQEKMRSGRHKPQQAWPEGGTWAILQALLKNASAAFECFSLETTEDV